MTCTSNEADQGEWHDRPKERATIGKGRLGLLSKRLGGPTHIEMETTELDALYQQLRDAGITPRSPPSKKPWDDVRDFVVVDPDGHVIEFGEAHDTSAAA